MIAGTQRNDFTVKEAGCRSIVDEGFPEEGEVEGNCDRGSLERNICPPTSFVSLEFIGFLLYKTRYDPSSLLVNFF
jgi:hypothetical protein